MDQYFILGIFLDIVHLLSYTTHSVGFHNEGVAACLSFRVDELVEAAEPALQGSGYLIP